ncbi:RNA-directed DNA polymerase from mobile element jockey [Eumeta japonica]|uniref:RNA-directed DNA polymerase from mobile element jockey n=1 Tax=Eumeta variegata TaxID=151549 RepID=A0A4C1UNP3_EUMVA|nr:RNA-directed DNA polymerase from mobile element jockey [Eumeta japonica]
MLTRKLNYDDAVVYMNGEHISLINEIRLLDPTTDRKLTFIPHVSKAWNKATNIYEGLAREAKATQNWCDPDRVGEETWYSTLRLDSFCTVFQMEMVALQRSIRRMRNGEDGLVNTFSDSRTSHVPTLWKTSQIVMIHKPGKPPNEASSYRPISLTPVLSKLWERIVLERLSPCLEINYVIPDHQYGFRKHHSTIEQVHRVYSTIRQCLEQKEYCSAAFLDVQQAFDRVWHKGLLCKIKKILPHSYYLLMSSYLCDRTFQVKLRDARSSLHLSSGVPQGSVLGPVLYNIFTSDLPQSPKVAVATFADDAAFLACSRDPKQASTLLQSQLNITHDWLTKWRIKASAPKSHHITFALRLETCPSVNLGRDKLPQSTCVKYLGFYLDRRMTWKDHIKISAMKLIFVSKPPLAPRKTVRTISFQQTTESSEQYTEDLIVSTLVCMQLRNTRLSGNPNSFGRGETVLN